MTDQTKEREAFEAWHQSAPKAGLLQLKRRDNGEYIDPFTYMLWEAWLARSQSSAPAWITVSERLPEPLDAVLFAVSYQDGVSKGYYVAEAKDDETGEIWNPAHFTEINLTGGTDFYMDEVTHWMPLPAPPKEQ